MKIDRIDHIVLTTTDIDKIVRFYTDILGMEEISFSGGRKALLFGRHKINSIYINDPDGNLIEISNYK